MKNLFLANLVALTSSADFFFTLLNMKKGIVTEGNPILAYCFSHWSWQATYFLKIGLSLVSFWAIALLIEKTSLPRRKKAFIKMFPIYAFAFAALVNIVLYVV